MVWKDLNLRPLLFWKKENWFKRNSQKTILLSILLLAFGLRVYKISENPPSLNWDEVSHGFNAYSILKTGKDEWGIPFPSIFRAYGDFKLPLYIYLTIIPVWLLGLNPLSVRLISVLSGVSLVLVGFLVAKKITKENRAGLITAFLIALMPWGLFLSRVAVEANLGAFLFSLAGYFWLCWSKDKKEKPLILAFLFFGLSIHAYNSARVLVPLVFLATIVWVLKSKKVKQLFLPFLLLVIFITPIIFQMRDDSAAARFFWVNPIDQGAVNQINEKRGQSSMPPLLTRLVYNRPTFFVNFALRNYLKHFSPRFWFIAGGDHYQFSLPGNPIVFGVLAPFILAGLIKLIKDKKLFLILWLLISFIPSAITKDSPHVLRIILGLVPMMVTAAIGLSWLEEFFKTNSKLKGKSLLAIFIFGVLVQFFIWWRNYWLVYRTAYSWSWQYGYKEVVDYVKKNYSDYDRIIFTKKYGEPHEFVLFYWPWQPNFYQQDPKKVWDYHANWYWVDAFDKFEFWNDWEVVGKTMMLRDQGITDSILLIALPGTWPKPGELLETIFSADGGAVFDIVRY
ncbi:MAG: glycosyltransferase family 39 protein, partial [Patescibacteria group bacterium]